MFKIGQLVNYHGRERASGVYQITHDHPVPRALPTSYFPAQN